MMDNLCTIGSWITNKPAVFPNILQINKLNPVTVVTNMQLTPGFCYFFVSAQGVS